MDDPQFTGTDPQLKGELDRVRRLIDERQFDAALALCRELVQRSPGVAEAWFWLGYVQSLGGQLQGAEAALLRAVELDPSSPLYRTNLSIAALGQGRATEAEQHARQAISLEGTNAAHW